MDKNKNKNIITKEATKMESTNISDLIENPKGDFLQGTYIAGAGCY